MIEDNKLVLRDCCVLNSTIIFLQLRENYIKNFDLTSTKCFSFFFLCWCPNNQVQIIRKRKFEYGEEIEMLRYFGLMEAFVNPQRVPWPN